MDGPTFGDTLAAVHSGQDSRVNSGPTILQYMARNGGVNDDGGALIALDGHFSHREEPLMNRLVNPPEAAWTAGRNASTAKAASRT